MSYLNIDRNKVNRDRERPVSKEMFGRGTHEVIIEHTKVKKASKGYDMLEVSMLMMLALDQWFYSDTRMKNQEKLQFKN